jgi:hypothetical protein
MNVTVRRFYVFYGSAATRAKDGTCYMVEAVGVFWGDQRLREQMEGICPQALVWLKDGPSRSQTLRASRGAQ